MIKKIIILFMSLPKTLFFNFYYFKFTKAIKLPILISYKVKLKKIGKRGSIECSSKFMNVKLGFSNGSFELGEGQKSYFYQDKSSKIFFGEKITICNAFHIRVNKNATLKLGNDLKVNSNFILSCDKEINIGDNSLIGWNVTIIDGDGHSIYNLNSNNKYNLPKKIELEKKVWIASNVIILKGSFVRENSIISSGAIVSNKQSNSNVILGGVPAKVIKENINWEEEWI